MIGNIFGIAALIGGAFFMFVGSFGLLRLPDFYTRNHATGKSDTLGIMLALFGLMLIEGFTLNTAKLLFVLIFVFLTSPAGTHALMNAAWHYGLKPWFKQAKKGQAECIGK